MGGNLTDLNAIQNQILPIYSRKLLEEQTPKQYFWNFCLLDPELKLDGSPGKEVMFNAVPELTGDGLIPDEDTPISIEKLGSSKTSIYLKEFGKGAQFSRFSTVASLLNMLDVAKTRLGKHYAITIDRYLRDVFFTTANKYYALTTGLSGAGYANVNSIFNVMTIDSVKEKAAGLDFPMWTDGSRGDYWIFIGTQRQIRQFNRDKLLVNKKNYAAPTDWLRGEVGMFEGVTYLSSTLMDDLILPGASANSKDVHRGLLIAPGAVGIVRSIAMRLSALAWDEVKRSQIVLWYALLGAGILQDYIYEIATEDGLPSYA